MKSFTLKLAAAAVAAACILPGTASASGGGELQCEGLQDVYKRQASSSARSPAKTPRRKSPDETSRSHD